MRRWRRGNCLVFALYMYWTKGGYLAIRKCKNFPRLHWFWSPNLRQWLSYKPRRNKTKFWYIALDKLWYKGKIVWGDSNEQNDGH